MIEYKNIQIKFGDFVAVDDLSLFIDKGEFFTFLGPSGCGKTTTLRTLVGFIDPTKGQLFLDGEDITHKPIEKRGIGMVFQSYALFPTMTVRQNIEFGLEENGWDKKKVKKRVEEVSKMVNLTEEQLTKNVSELSGGQQQQVAIARALSLNPSVIVLDEPLSNLDAKLRKQLRLELKKIQRKSGTTMIYVTHDQEEAMSLSDRLAVFNEGKIQQVGTPYEIYYKPANPFVATSIGDRYKVDQNFIDVVEKNNPGLRVLKNKDHYIRTEGIRLREKTDDITDKDTYLLPAKLISEEFLGTFIRREFDVNGTIVPSVSFAHTYHPIEDPNVELIFHEGDLFSFEVDKHGQ